MNEIPEMKQKKLRWEAETVMRMEHLETVMVRSLTRPKVGRLLIPAHSSTSMGVHFFTYPFLVLEFTWVHLGAYFWGSISEIITRSTRSG